MKKLLFLSFFFYSLIVEAQKNISPPIPKSFNLGIVDEITSSILNEKRILNIYLPQGYNKQERYPVIYVLDGSADEDFIHIAGLVQYFTFPWIERIPKSIVVGIANKDRKRDFTSIPNQQIVRDRYPTSGGSDKFMAFIENELQPYISKNYTTTNEKTIIGQSLGGLLATEILFKKPHLFDQYIIISPSLWWNDGELLKLNPDVLKENFQQNKSIYIGVGKEGLGPIFDNHVMEVDANLLFDKIKYGKSKTVKVVFDYLPEEDHATVTHPAVFNAFKLLYPKKNH
ncbi:MULTISPECIES: alpha/beta hydrolase [Flavobacterium]|uniref:Alpha/beta hydrolase n=2 Tax=Flavobacterium TaxID=237 RepID=A0AA94F1T9_9FLAO|nr:MULTISPECIES: alpha/beta hydrolase-fold protein [Flavobacterium]OXA83284.1 esterase [Flavobacterium columnare] [Flavobacterium columnare NBRC 100251 = ATCC 23463]AMA49597.1 esterase [Flavobacterium covae]MCH4828883.1 alpha/beta hydrolase [Flavobacterium columnare]MCH4832137.1 alpha/beta hydrolase [Flavobacterium columnare]MCJ1806034.1 alpha/beta hydrolase-fold protein [Flavobacterium covae]